MMFFIWVLLFQLSSVYTYNCEKVNIFKQIKSPKIYVYKANLYTNRVKSSKERIETREKFNILKKMIKTSKYNYVEETVSTGHTHSLFTSILGIPESFYLQRHLDNILLKIVKPKTNNFVFIKSIQCGKNFKTKLSYTLDEFGMNIEKEMMNKIDGIEQGKIKILQNVKLKLENEEFIGYGKEKHIIYLSKKTRIKHIEDIAFSFIIKNKYNDQETKVSGKLDYKLIKIVNDKNIRKSNITENKTINKISFFNMNSYGIFVQAKINDTIQTRLYLDPSSTISLMDFNFFIKNIFKKPKTIQHYFKSVRNIDILNSHIKNPRFEVLKHFVWEKYFDGISYKTPGVLAGDVLSKGILYINEPKRKIAFFKNKNNKILKKILKKIQNIKIPIKIKNYIPVFKMKINNSNIRASISLAHFNNFIFSRIQNELKLPSKRIVISKHNKELISQKVNMIINPKYGKYFNSSAIVTENLRNKPYDLELGVQHIKGKKMLINYQDKYIVIW